MSCPVEDDGDDLIIAYGAGTLDPEQERKLEEHFQICARCRELAEAQRAVWSALETWPTMVVSENFDARLYQRIAMEHQKSGWRSWLPTAWAMRPAVPVGVACAALVAAFLLKDPALRPLHPSPAIPAAPAIEQVEQALDDMEMLTQLGVENPADKAAATEKI